MKFNEIKIKMQVYFTYKIYATYPEGVCGSVGNGP
jgi:hypothetical protein